MVAPLISKVVDGAVFDFPRDARKESKNVEENSGYGSGAGYGSSRGGMCRRG